jgi:hypothetical protein
MNKIFIIRLEMICAPLMYEHKMIENKILKSLHLLNLKLNAKENLNQECPADWIDRINGISSQQNAAESRLNYWCGANIGGFDFFKGTDKLEILKPQKHFNFDTFEAKYRILNEADKDKSTENRKVNFENYRKINLVNEFQEPRRLSSWISSRKTIEIHIYDEIYYLSVDLSHKLGDLWKTISRWIDVVPNEIIVHNEKNRLPEEYLWNIIQTGGNIFKVGFEHNNFVGDCYELILFDPKKIILPNNDKKLQFLFHKDIKLITVKRILLKQLNAERVWVKLKLNENLYAKGQELMNSHSHVI